MPLKYIQAGIQGMTLIKKTSTNPQQEGIKLQLYPLLSTERSLFPLTIEIQERIDQSLGSTDKDLNPVPGIWNYLPNLLSFLSSLVELITYRFQCLVYFLFQLHDIGRYYFLTYLLT